MVFMVTRLGIVFNVIERRGRTVLAVLCMAQFVAVLDANALIVALPQIGRELRMARRHAAVGDHGLRRSSTPGCLLAGGRIADALGRKRVFLAGLALFTAASLACALAPTAAALIAARALQGLGAALLAPAAAARLLPQGRRARLDRDRRGRRRLRADDRRPARGHARLALGVPDQRPDRRSSTLVLAARLVPEARGERKPLDLRGAAPPPPASRVRLRPGRAAVAAAARGVHPARVRPRAPEAPGPGRLVVTAGLLTAATSGGAVLATLELQTHLGPFGAGLHLLPLSVAVVAGSLVRRLPISAGLALVALGSALAARSASPPGPCSPGSGSARPRSPRPRSACAAPRTPAAPPACSAPPRRSARRSGVATLVGLSHGGFLAAAAVTAAGAGLARWSPRGVAADAGSAPR